MEQWSRRRRLVSVSLWLALISVVVTVVLTLTMLSAGARTPARLSAAEDRAGAAGSGAPPSSFWGRTSRIPAAQDVLEVKVINRTNGHFASQNVYWSFDGTERSIARQQFIDMPANSAGRMYFYLGSRASITFLLRAGGGLYWLIPAAVASLLGGVINTWLFLVRAN